MSQPKKHDEVKKYCEELWNEHTICHTFKLLHETKYFARAQYLKDRYTLEVGGVAYHYSAQTQIYGPQTKAYVVWCNDIPLSLFGCGSRQLTLSTMRECIKIFHEENHEPTKQDS